MRLANELAAFDLAAAVFRQAHKDAIRRATRPDIKRDALEFLAAQQGVDVEQVTSAQSRKGMDVR